MLRYTVLMLLLLHGAIHIMGFAKAFGYAEVPQLTKDISRTAGTGWFIAALLFIAAALILLFRKDAWWIIALVAVLLSQLLIIIDWKDAKYGSIINLLLLMAVLSVYGVQRFENSWKKDVKMLLQRPVPVMLLTDSMITELPVPVQQYIRYTGALNKPVPFTASISFRGEMRSKTRKWFPFVSRQYNSFDYPERLFFMKGRMMGITVPGYHCYKNNTASMQVKLMGIMPVADFKGPEMDKAETVTWLNDLCLFAPGALTDKRFSWQTIDDTTAEIIFSNADIKVSATLYFNTKGELVNFVSDDRIEINEQRQYRFSTPVSNYKNFNGLQLPSYGETVWHYPDGAFVYGKFSLQQITYNCSDSKL